MLLYTATLKDSRVVQTKELEMEDKRTLLGMYESVSEDALQWGMPPYEIEVIDRWLDGYRI
jgi:hypothetical protein